MAITRIKNNQITDSTVNAAAKLQDFSITSGKIANNLTYGSDLTVAGNLTISGTTTTVETTNLSVEDALLLFASGQTGTPTVDVGFLGERGDETNVAFVWDESEDKFVAAFTSSSDTDTTVTVGSYADLEVADFDADNAGFSGNVDIAGDANITGNITGANFEVSGDISVANIDASGSIVADTIEANTSATLASLEVTDLTDDRVLIAGASGEVEDSESLTFDGTTLNVGTESVSGEIVASGNITGDNVISDGDVTTATVTASSTIDATGNVSGGNITTAGVVSATGNVSGGNITTAGVVSATGNVIGDNLVTTGVTDTGSLTASTTIDATGNVSGGNITTAGVVSATGNVSGGNLTTAGVTDTGSLTASTTIDATGNVSGGNITTAGVVSATGNVNGGNITTSGTTQTGTLSANTTVTATGNVSGGNITTSGITQTGTLSANTTVTATGNVSGGNITTAGAVDATGNVSGGNITTAGIVDADGNINGLNFNAGTSVVAPNVEITSATTNEVFFTDANNQLRTDANLTFDTSNLELTGKLTVDNVIVDDNTITSPANVDVVVDNSGTGIFYVDRDTTVSGNLSVLGTTTTVNSTETTIEDPILQLGRGANNDPLTTSDGKDRGIAMYYYDAEEKVAFMGYDDPSDEWRFFVDATITDEAVTGTLGDINVGGITTTSIDSSGNIAGANLTTVGVVDATGNVIAGNLTTAGTTQTGDLSANTTITATGNVSGGNITTTGVVDATGNVSGGNLVTTGVTDTGSLTASTTITATGNVSGGNITTAGVVDATGNVSGGNITTAGTTQTGDLSANTTITATGNVSGGNLVTAGTTQTGDLSANTTITATGNVSGGNITTAGVVNATGNVNGGNLVTTGVTDTGSLTASTTISATGNVTGGNLTTDGTVDATGNVSGGNIVTTGVTDTGSLTASTTISATGNVSGGNITTAGVVDATGNVNGGNLVTTGAADAATVSASTSVTTPTVTSTSGLNITSASNGDITLDPNGSGEVVLPDQGAEQVLFTTANNEISTSSNATFDGENLDITGSLTVDNVRIDDEEIRSLGTELIFNRTNGDVDFIVSGNTVDNLFYVDAGTDTIAIGSGNVVAGAVVTIDDNSSIVLPSGTTAQRPETPAEGMFRYNNTEGDVEFFDGSEWVAAGTTFTLISSETFSGDGSTTEFTLDESSTTASAIVTINGVVQLPTTAYAISGTTLTFTEAPESGDGIEVRRLTTTTTVAGLTNADSTATLTAIDGEENFRITGNLTPSTNDSYDLGASDKRWNELYLSGSTISLGNIQIKETSGNSIGFFESDGVTPATLDASAEISADNIASGNSNIAFASGGGNATVSIGGTANVGVFTDDGLVVTGSIEATNGFVGLDATTIEDGTSSVSVTSAGGDIIANVDGSTVATFNSSGISAELTGNVTGDVTGQVSDISNHSTSDLSEGTNLYYTDTRARNALSAAGDLSYNSTTGAFSFTERTDAEVRGLVSASGDLNYNSSTGEFSVTTYKSSDFNSDFSGKSTDDLSEGSNLYYTDSRVNNHLSGGTGVSYSDGSISIGQDVGTTESVSFNSVTLGSAPTSPNQAARKAYVDEVAQGLKVRQSADLLQKNGLNANYDNGTNGVGATLTSPSTGSFPSADGVTPDEAGTRILVIDQTDAAHNGLYVLTTVGDGSTPWVLTRCSNCDEADEIPGSFVFVSGGDTYASTGWVADVNDPGTFTVGTDDIDWIQFSGTGTYTAGTGLTLDGTEFQHSDTSSQSSVDNSGGTVIQDISLDTFGHITNIGSKSLDTGDIPESGNLYYTDARANSAIDSRVTKTFVDNLNVDADTLDGQNGSHYLDFGNATNKPDPTITLAGDLSGSVTLTNLGNGTLTASVADDSHNHVISNVDGLQSALNAKADDSTTISAGSGLTGGGSIGSNRTISHADTSSQGSVNNSGGTVIQDITLDGFGHITDINSSNLDSRYLLDSGDTMSGDLNMGGNDILNAGTINGTATSAQYADLAENYVADAAYEPGTVVAFGGTEEVTVSDADSDARIAGVISTNPSYLMNSTAEGEHVAAVALTGRVPTRVTGNVRKGDMMVSNGDGTARAESAPSMGTVIGKALENFDGEQGTIEVVVGRL